MSLLADLETWIAAGLGADAPPVGAVVNGNWLPDEPDEVVVVNLEGGSTPVIDGAFEQCRIRIRSRAATDPEAETLADAVHALFTALNGSLTMGSTYVLWTEPSAGKPSYLGRDVKERTVYASQYAVCAAV